MIFTQEQDSHKFSLSEKFIVTDYSDLRKYSLFDVENAKDFEAKIRNLDDVSLTLLRSDDLSDMGAIGLYIMENDSGEGSVYAGYDYETDEPKQGDYVLAILDRNKIDLNGVQEEQGKLVCVIKEEKSTNYLVCRCPLVDLALLTKKKITSEEEVSASIKVVEDNKSEIDKGTTDTFRINELLLEGYRDIYGLWEYCGSHDEMNKIYQVMEKMVGIPVVGSTLGEYEEYVSEESNWDDGMVAGEVWKAKSVFDGLDEFVIKSDHLTEDEEQRIVDLIVSLVQKCATYTAGEVDGISHKLVGTIEDKFEDKEKVEFVKNQIELLTEGK